MPLNRKSICIVALFATLLLSACASAEYDVIEKIDPTQKTVAMAAGGNRGAIKIKQQLRASGWKVLALGNVITSQATGNRVLTSKAAGARYTLEVELKRIDVCITGEATLLARAVLVDNKTNAEVFTYSARACEDDVVANIVQLMNSDTPSKPKFSS